MSELRPGSHGDCACTVHSLTGICLSSGTDRTVREAAQIIPGAGTFYKNNVSDSVIIKAYMRHQNYVDNLNLALSKVCAHFSRVRPTYWYFSCL